MSAKENIERAKRIIKQGRRNQQRLAEYNAEKKMLRNEQKRIIAELNEEFGIRNVEDLDEEIKRVDMELSKYLAFESDEYDED